MAKESVSDSVSVSEKQDPLTQAPTIRDAVTYIVDENGNEIKQPVEGSQQKIESSEG